MTNKEYILKVIDALPDWEMWRWLKAMVQNDQLDEDALNTLVIILNKALNRIKTAIKEHRMLETIHAVQNFDRQKQEMASQDAESLNKLDSMLNDL